MGGGANFMWVAIFDSYDRRLDSFIAIKSKLRAGFTVKPIGCAGESMPAMGTGPFGAK